MPGHTAGHVAFAAPGFALVGDTLFAGSVGRTDFPGGNAATLKQNIQAKLFSLADDVIVYPGHMEPTTVGKERRTNPFVGENGML